MTTTSDWQSLFKLALKILSQQQISGDQWSFGGGTALMLQYQHRKSKDVDIFLRDAQLLTRFTPRLNDFVAERVDDYTEMSNFLKLKKKDQEIDFIVAPFLTPEPTSTRIIFNVPVQVETPEEIVIKKIFYRAESFKVRDLFDLAVVLQDKKSRLVELRTVYQGKIELLRHRLKSLKPIYEAELSGLDLIDLMAAGDAFQRVGSFLDDIDLSE